MDSYYENLAKTPGLSQLTNAVNTVRVEDAISQVNYMKFFILSVNKELEEARLDKPLTLKELDNLDHDTFVKLIVYLLTSPGLYHPDQLKEKTEMLIGLQGAGLPGVEYDATLDHIYHAAKRLFKEGDERLSYTLFLKPSSNPKLAREVLEYLVRFVIFVENCNDIFDKINLEVTTENEKRNELHRQIAEMNAKIEQKQADMAERRAALPQLHAKLNELNAEVAEEEDVVADLEKEVANYKKIYDVEEQKKLNLERKLEEAQQRRQRLEALAHLDTEAKKLQQLMQEREEVGKEVSKVKVEDDKMWDIVKRGEDVLRDLDEGIKKITQTLPKVEEHDEAQSKLRRLQETLKSIVLNLNHLTYTKEKIHEQNQVEYDAMIKKIKIVQTDMEALLGQLESLKVSRSKEDQTVSHLTQDLASVRLDIQDKATTLQKNNVWMETFAQELEDWAQFLAESIASFVKKLD